MTPHHQLLAQHLAQVHRHMLAGTPVPFEKALRAQDSTLPAQAAGVLQGCRMLGFPDPDALILQAAWERQSQRLGSFMPNLWPDHPADFGIPLKPRTQAFASCPEALGLYAVVPTADWVARMAAIEVPTVQLRFKSDDPRATAREVRAAVRAVDGTGTRLFINDHWFEALDEGAYGVHLGQLDLAEAPMQRLREAGLRLGLTACGYADLVRAEAWSPSYLALGSVFATSSKALPFPPQGLGRLRAYAKLMRHRTFVAIGGIDEARVTAVKRLGVASIAVVNAIIGARHPEVAVRRLQQRMSLAG